MYKVHFAQFFQRLVLNNVIGLNKFFAVLKFSNTSLSAYQNTPVYCHYCLQKREESESAHIQNILVQYFKLLILKANSSQFASFTAYRKERGLKAHVVKRVLSRMLPDTSSWLQRHKTIEFMLLDT